MMTPEEKRLVIAEAVLTTLSDRWVFAPDHAIPESARFYAVYDGARICSARRLLGGSHVEKERGRIAELVARAKMPIVFYLTEVDGVNHG